MQSEFNLGRDEMSAIGYEMLGGREMSTRGEVSKKVAVGSRVARNRNTSLQRCEIPSIEWEKRYRRSLSSRMRPVCPVISTLGLSVYLITISAVSIYDMALTIKYPFSLKELELNPVGRWMMGLDQIPCGGLPDLSYFLLAKFLGTWIVMSVLFWLVVRRKRIGHLVGLGVAACQLILAFYLHYGEI